MYSKFQKNAINLMYFCQRILCISYNTVFYT